MSASASSRIVATFASRPSRWATASESRSRAASSESALKIGRINAASRPCQVRADATPGRARRSFSLTALNMSRESAVASRAELAHAGCRGGQHVRDRAFSDVREVGHTKIVSEQIPWEDTLNTRLRPANCRHADKRALADAQAHRSKAVRIPQQGTDAAPWSTGARCRTALRYGAPREVGSRGWRLRRLAASTRGAGGPI